MKKLTAFFTVILLVMSLLPAAALAAGAVESITVKSAGDATTVNVGGTLQMTADVLPADADDKSVAWSVQNGTGSASIGADTGLLTGTGAGTVTVRATAKDGSEKYGEMAITVTAIPVTGITVTANGGATSVHVDETLQLSAAVSPADATDKSVTWSVASGTGKATISTAGVLKGTEEGTVTVRATAKDGSGIHGDLQLTVTQKPGYFTVRFHLNGAAGTAPAPQNVANGGKATKPANPVRVNFAFRGWYSDAACRHIWNFSKGKVTGNLTLYAKWVQTIFPYQLSKIQYSAGRLKGTFRPACYNYTIQLGEYEGDITVTPVKAFPGSKMKIDGSAIAAKSIHVDNGKTKRMYITVTGGGRTKTYRLAITRAASRNNHLAALESSGAPLSPAFTRGHADYTVELPENVDRTKITARAEAPTVTRVYGTGTYVLKKGEYKRVTIRVRSQTGKSRYYHITIHRKPSTNANLASIRTSSVYCKLKEPFNADTLSYTVTMPSNIASITLTPKAADSLAKITTKVTIGGVTKTTNRVTLAGGQTATVKITVTAQSKATKTYTVTVNRLKAVIDKSSPYYIYVEKGGHSLTVFGKDEKGEYTKLIKTFLTGIGRPDKPTPVGLFRISKKERWHRFNKYQVVQYACKYTSGLYIHSPVYSETKIDKMVPHYYTEIGSNKTHGCLRMVTGACYWIYQNCPVGTYVEIVSGAPKGYVGEKKPPIDPKYPRVDPTDPLRPGA